MNKVKKPISLNSLLLIAKMNPNVRKWQEASTRANQLVQKALPVYVYIDGTQVVVQSRP